MSEETKIKIKRSAQNFSPETSQLTLEEGEPFLYTNQDTKVQKFYIGDGKTLISQLDPINKSVTKIDPKVDLDTDGWSKVTLSVESGSSKQDESSFSVPRVNVINKLSENESALQQSTEDDGKFMSNNSSSKSLSEDVPVYHYQGDILVVPSGGGSTYGNLPVGTMLICADSKTIQDASTSTKNRYYTWKVIYADPSVKFTPSQQTSPSYNHDDYELSISTVGITNENTSILQVRRPTKYTIKESEVSSRSGDGVFYTTYDTTKTYRFGDRAEYRNGSNVVVFDDLILVEEEITIDTIKYTKWISPSEVARINSLQSIKNDSIKVTKYSVESLKESIVNLIYPVGTYFTTSDSQYNPNNTFGGSWTLTSEQAPYVWHRTA